MLAEIVQNDADGASAGAGFPGAGASSGGPSEDGLGSYLAHTADRDGPAGAAMAADFAAAMPRCAAGGIAAPPGSSSSSHTRVRCWGGAFFSGGGGDGGRPAGDGGAGSGGSVPEVNMQLARECIDAAAQAAEANSAAERHLSCGEPGAAVSLLQARPPQMLSGSQPACWRSSLPHLALGLLAVQHYVLAHLLEAIQDLWLSPATGGPLPMLFVQAAIVGTSCTLAAGHGLQLKLRDVLMRAATQAQQWALVLQTAQGLLPIYSLIYLQVHNAVMVMAYQSIAYRGHLWLLVFLVNQASAGVASRCSPSPIQSSAFGFCSRGRTWGCFMRTSQRWRRWWSKTMRRPRRPRRRHASCASQTATATWWRTCCGCGTTLKPADAENLILTDGACRACLTA